jgi:Z1 domain
MHNENSKKIIDTVLVTLPPDSYASEEDISSLAERLRVVFPVDDEEFTSILKTLHYKLPITMDMGSAVIAEDHVSWYYAEKPEITPYYWDRYEKFLIKEENWTPNVTGSLDRVTDRIMDFMGNPKSEGSWKRRGLVMGDVQSGKTSTYTALSCKAADAGYKLIILLTGTLENLRRQTQERLDSGFVGRESSGILTKKKQNKLIGTGLIDSNRHPGVFTSEKNDFKSNLVNQLGFKVDSHMEPILLVVKKNKRILENLESWLRDYNADVNGVIDTPLLLIDDEADNASVNTTASGQPTAINTGIRSILKLFTRSTYIGFTATPFANIFIDPESKSKMIDDDLFPRDFIYSLDPPSNYIGAEAIFGNETAGKKVLREIDDAEAHIPTGHKSTFIVEDLPQSLETALLSFILANTIRDLRNEGPSHRSMLVNVSRFTDVQENVAELIDSKLRKIQQDIRHYSQLSEQEANSNPSIASLFKVWKKEYSKLEFSWNEIRLTLLKAALPIVVITVNQKKKKGKATLDYKAHKKDGLRVIAVGGNSLSRGLTLEGLCVSYFYRNSQMYDTLMQMGRWFGYREGYSDLCRVWMTGDAIHWYRHITEATLELRNEIKKMGADGLTPEEFGLKVRTHPESVIVSVRNLIVTARNKMRTAKEVQWLVSFSEQGPETPRIHTNSEIIKANANAVERMINSLKFEGIQQETSKHSDSNTWKGVHKQIIIELLRTFNVHSLNFNFQADSIAAFLEKTNDEMLERWDILLPNGSVKNTEPFCGISYRMQKRRVHSRGNGKYILVSGSSARVGSRGVEKEGIRLEEVAKIDQKAKKENRNPSDKEYREIRERPLLILHFIKAEIVKGKNVTLEEPLIALGLSFPRFDDSSDEKKVTYQVNVIKWKELFEEEMDDDELEEEEELEEVLKR